MPGGLPGTMGGTRLMLRRLHIAPSGYGAREPPSTEGGRRAHHPAHHHRAPAALRRLRLQPPRSADLSGHAFGSGRPFTVGVEEELFLVDPLTGAQINASTAVQERIGPCDGTVERELHACQLELITEVCASAGEAIDALDGCAAPSSPPAPGCSARARIPSAAEGDAEITDKERYERIRDLLGDAVATPVGGLHIHVGCPMPRRRSAPSTGCAATCRCCRRWPPTRRFATAATPAWPRRAR